MNPYQPPQCNDPAVVATGPAVMQVRYSLGYSLGVIFAGLVMILSAIRIVDFAPLAGGLFILGGAGHITMGYLTRRLVFFEVFPDRIEFLSPVFPRWRRAKPLHSIGPRSFLYRWFTKREDFKRFIAWLEGSAVAR